MLKSQAINRAPPPQRSPVKCSYPLYHNTRVTLPAALLRGGSRTLGRTTHGPTVGNSRTDQANVDSCRNTRFLSGGKGWDFPDTGLGGGRRVYTQATEKPTEQNT